MTENRYWGESDLIAEVARAMRMAGFDPDESAVETVYLEAVEPVIADLRGRLIQATAELAEVRAMVPAIRANLNGIEEAATRGRDRLLEDE